MARYFLHGERKSTGHTNYRRWCQDFQVVLRWTRASG
jgi:hypothetical protein